MSIEVIIDKSFDTSALQKYHLSLKIGIDFLHSVYCHLNSIQFNNGYVFMDDTRINSWLESI